MTIISFFFGGGIFGGIFYSSIGLYVLAIAGAILIAGLIYDHLRIDSKE